MLSVSICMEYICQDNMVFPFVDRSINNHVREIGGYLSSISNLTFYVLEAMVGEMTNGGHGLSTVQHV